jgi:hypothetical protein
MYFTIRERLQDLQHFKGGTPDPPPPKQPPKPPSPTDAAENLRLQRMKAADKDKRGFRSTIYTGGVLSKGLITQNQYGTSILGG